MYPLDYKGSANSKFITELISIDKMFFWKSCASSHTVVKWGHLKALFKGKNFVWKIYQNFPLNLRVLPAEGNTLRFWWKYLQKVNAKRPQISDEKEKFFLFDKIRIKSYLSKRKKLTFLIRNLRAFCIHFLQVLLSESEGITFCR